MICTRRDVNMLILELNKNPCCSLADYMLSTKFEFVLKKNKAENRILNDFTLSSCRWRLTLTFKSQFEQFPYGEDIVFTFMLENTSGKRKAPTSHCYNFLLFFLTYQLTSWTSPRATHSKVMRATARSLRRHFASYKTNNSF